MPPRRRSAKDSPAKLAQRLSRRWRVVLLRSKGETLGEVEAPDAEAAVAVAATQFDLDEVQRKRLSGVGAGVSCGQWGQKPAAPAVKREAEEDWAK
jgi:hypothetical protein